jgi:hypothetical protein
MKQHKLHKEITRSYKKTILERLESDNEFWDIIFKTQYPLSDDEIRDIVIECNSVDLIEEVMPETLNEFARAIEKAHGIGEDK